MKIWLATLGLVALLAAGATAMAVSHHRRGYFAPQFTRDGQSVLVVEREVRAVVLGFGYEMFTPPAHVRILHDRFRLLQIRIADGHTTVLQAFPPTPLEGRWIESYRSGLYGSAHVALRWARPDALEYEIGITNYRVPTAETFVVRRRVDPATGRITEDQERWRPGTTGMGGDEPSQLHGDREVVAVNGDALMPCAIAIVTQGQPQARAIVETADCRRANPQGYAVSALTDQLRRAEIERVEHLKQTHQRLVAEARAAGMSEGDAALAAIRGMRRLGLYPKTAVIVARPLERAPAQEPVIHISDDEFRVGLFQDLSEAIEHPGEEIEKSMGSYVTHRDYDTSRQVNERLRGSDDAAFVIEARGRLWRIEVDRP